MNSGLAKSILAHLNDWTWVAVEYRVWVIILATAIGLALPLLSAARRDMPRPAPSLVVRSGAVGLALSSALMAVCSLLHFSDQRWLPVSQRGSVHVSAPGGVFGFAKPAVGVINSVANLPVEWRATQVAVHTAIICAFLTMAALALIILTWRRARRAEIRQVVQEEMQRIDRRRRPVRRLRRRHHVGVPVDERRVVAAEGEQLLVGAALGDLPWSRTRISSASRMVDSRCAIVIVVRPALTLSMASWTACSVWLSRALVASSRTRIGGLRSTARAIARRCFSPPENR